MERDFLGLNMKDSVEMIGEGIKDGYNDTVFMRGSGMQWPYSNRVLTRPQFMPFQAVQEERSKRIVFDPLSSSGCTPISTADAFETNHRTFTGVVQKFFTPERQGGTHYAMKAHPIPHIDEHSAYRPHNIRTSVSKNTTSVPINNPFFNSHVPTSGHNTFMKQQSLGGVPNAAPHFIVPCPGFVAGTADLRNDSKPAGKNAQLTIFYGGSVNSYDDVSAEKAQAIMLLAGIGSSMIPDMETRRAQMQAPTSKPVEGDGFHGNQSHSTSHCSGSSSPVSVTSHLGAFTAPRRQPEPPNITILLSAASLLPAAVTQARKVSLARFLEKRRERIMNTIPYYNMSKI